MNKTAAFWFVELGDSERNMLAVDANVLVRLLARDDVSQVRAAEASITKGAWVSQLVLAETLRVLDSVYDLSRAQSETAVELLLNHKELSLQDADVVAADSCRPLAVFRD
jgi:predicted nucleic-acid-binding protein